MNNAEFGKAWQSLKIEIDEKPVPQALGLDLIRGELLETSHAIENLHLQVFGRDAFLRNMLQRILVWDMRQYVSVILLASGKEAGLLEEVANVINGIKHSREHILLLYSPFHPKLSVRSFHARDLFERETFQKLRHYHLYAELGNAYRQDEHSLLEDLKSEIKRRFAKEEDSPALSYKPFVYIFRPEALPKDYLITDRTKDLKDCACFYPVRQSLGKLPYQRPSEFSKWDKKPERPSATTSKSGGEDTTILKIIEDLRPKK